MVDYTAYVGIAAVIVFIAFMIYRIKRGNKNKPFKSKDTPKEIRENLNDVLAWFSDKDFPKRIRRGVSNYGRVQAIMPHYYNGDILTALKKLSRAEVVHAMLEYEKARKAAEASKKEAKPVKAAVKEVVKDAVEKPKVIETVLPFDSPKLKFFYLARIRKPRFFFPLSIFFGKKDLFCIPSECLAWHAESLELMGNTGFTKHFGVWVANDAARIYILDNLYKGTLETALEMFENAAPRFAYLEEKVASKVAVEENKVKLETKRYQAQTEAGVAS